MDYINILIFHLSMEKTAKEATADENITSQLGFQQLHKVEFAVFTSNISILLISKPLLNE